MKLPKVFVVSETQKHNIIPAADFGDIEIVLPPNQAQVISRLVRLYKESSGR
jgi:hypothetical protein